MRIVMTRDVALVSPDAPLQEAARRMQEADAGSLPVGEDDRLVGMITDRDIAVRSVAQGKSADGAKVRDVMSQGIRYCFEDEDVREVAHLAMLNRDKQPVGIISLGDVATGEKPEIGGEALRGCCQ